jgi:hypothetical protein
VKHTSLYHRAISLTLTTVFLGSSLGLPQLAEANFWKERSDARLAMLPAGFQTLPSLQPAMNTAVSHSLSPRLEALVAGSQQKKLRSVLASLPSSLGSVRDVSIASADAPVLVHIQDIHQNAEAQKNIENLIMGLSAPQAPDFIALEGAFKPLDIASLRSFPDPAALKTVAENMLQANEIAGPVAASLITTSPAPALIGVDDRRAYDANVSAYLRSLKTKASLQEKLSAVEKKLERQKSATFNPVLWAFDKKVAAHRAGDLPLGDYAAAIAKASSSLPVPVAAFLQAARMEKALNFQNVEAERARLLEQLVRRLSAKESRALIDISSAFRQGSLTHEQFYSSLKDFCERVGVQLASYPSMDAYIRYVALADRIDAEEVLTALDSMETAAYDRLSGSVSEKQLIESSRLASTLRRLFAFELTPDEWLRYEPHHAMALNFGFTPADIEPYESFYRAAQVRDHAMVANLLKSAQQRKSREVFLVAGGFHSAGVKRLAKAAGFSVVTFAPRITKVDGDSGSAYLSVFAQEKTPLEKLVAGQPLFLAKEPLTSALVDKIGASVIPLGISEGKVSEAQAAGWFKQLTGWYWVVVERVSSSRVAIHIQRTYDSLKVTLNSTVQGEVGVVFGIPLWETIGLAVANLLLTSTVVSGPLAPWLLGVAFAFSHSDLYAAKTYEQASTLRGKVTIFAGLVVWRSMFGTLFVALLAKPHGFIASYAAHSGLHFLRESARLSALRNPTGWFSSMLKIAGRLPLMAIIGGSSPTYYAQRTNNVRKIVNAVRVVKIEGKASVIPSDDSVVPSEPLTDEGVAEEKKEFAAAFETAKEAALAADEMDLAEGFMLYFPHQEKRIFALMDEKKISYPAALSEFHRILAQQQAGKSDMTVGIIMACIEAMLKAAHPAVALTDEQIAEEITKFEAAKEEVKEKAVKNNDWDMAEAVGFYLGSQENAIFALMQEQRVPYSTALSELVLKLREAQKENLNMSRTLIISAMEAILESATSSDEEEPDYILPDAGEGPFALLIKNPNLAQSTRILRHYKGQIVAIAIDGPMEGHWTTVEAKENGIPAFGNFKDSIFDIFQNGDIATFNGYTQKITRNPSPAEVEAMDSAIEH